MKTNTISILQFYEIEKDKETYCITKIAIFQK